MATTVSQLSCLSSPINRRFKLHKLSILNRNNNNKNSLTLGTSFANPLKYTAVSCVSHMEATEKNPPPIIEENSDGVRGDPLLEIGTSQPEMACFVDGKIQTKGKAEIPDYFFGFPYGLLVLSGGLLGFILSRDRSNLTYGVLIGFAILSLSKASQVARGLGIFCLPFTLGQAVLSTLLLLKNMQNYLLTKALLPATLGIPALNLLISAAMLFFYLDVVISGGNPPRTNKPVITCTIAQRDEKDNSIKMKQHFF